jgi:hypothetical protein
MIVASIFVALAADIEPPTDRFVMLGGAATLAAMVAGSWWGMIALYGHFKRSLHA